MAHHNAALTQTQTRTQTQAAHVAVANDAETSSDEEVRKTLRARVLELLRLYLASLSEKDRAFFVRSIAEKTANGLGARVSPRDVAAEYVRVLLALSPWVLAHKVGSYGPMRARYGLELVLAMVPDLSAHVAQSAVIDVASATPDPAEAITPAKRREARRAVRKLTADPTVSAAIERSLSPVELVGHRVRAHERTIARARHVRANVSAELRGDMGLDDATLDALIASASGAIDSADVRAKGRRSQQALRSNLAPSCGRLVHELRELLGAASRMRADDPTVPALSSTYVPARKAKRAAAEPPQPVATPVTPSPAQPR